jgi:hypothetical protein
VEAALAHLRASVPGAQIEGIAADAGPAAGCASITAAWPEVEVLILVITPII